MALTITGGKYASAILLTANVNTLEVATTPFVSTDFSIQRIVGLWNSAGTTFKGIAYIRRWLTTSTLELTKPFLDPATGLEVTQVVGDTIIVSKNFAESVGTGLAVSGNTVTVTTDLILGTAGVSNSLCLYDEAKNISVAVASGSAIKPTGGICVLGQLQDYNNFSTGKSCSIFYVSGTSYGVVMSNASAMWCMFGGSIDGATAGGGAWNGGYGGTSPNFQIWMNVVNGREFISPLAGGNWINPTRQRLLNCTIVGAGICIRWGNGDIVGGSYKMQPFAPTPYSMFGSDTVGTYNIGAPAGKRLTVNINGRASGSINMPSLWRASTGSPAQTINFTNVVSYDRRATSTNATPIGANHINATQRFYFNDNYTNLVPNTVGVILRGDGVVSASIASVTSLWSPSVLQEVWNGVNRTTTYDNWTYGFKAYGFNPVFGAFSKTSYLLEGALVADNVELGGVMNQLVDTGVTLSKSAALALSSKFAAVSTGNGTLTVTGSATLDEVYDYLIAWGCSSVALAQFPSLSAYPATASGTALSTAMSIVVNTGVTLSAGTKFKTIATTGGVTFATGGTVSGLQIVGNVFQATPSNLSGIVITGNLTYNQATNITVTLTDTTITGTVSNSGAGLVSISPAGTTSVGAAGVNVTVLSVPHTVTFVGLPVGCDVVILTAGTSTVLVQVDQIAGTSYAYTYTGTLTVDVGFIKPSFVPLYLRNVVLAASDSSIPVNLTPDRNYS